MTPPAAPQSAAAAEGHAVPPPECPAHARADGPRLYGPEHAADPRATFAELRKQGSVATVEIAPGVEVLIVLGYRSALEVLRSPDRFSKDPRRWQALSDGTVPADSPVVPMMMYRPHALWADGEEHARFRGAITDSLAQVDPNALRGYVEESADVLIDRIGARGTADLLGEYGALLPMLVFNRLFDCPADIGDKLVFGMSGIFDAKGDAEEANRVLTEGAVELVALRRREPGADVTSWMMAHPAQLDDEEMLHQIVLLMGAGTEPEQNLICNALLLLLSDDRFAGDLAGGSMPVDEALDEVLWSDAPVANYAVHYALQDTEVDGIPIAAGRPILISFTAANTDPELDGERRAGNRAHLAWSAGPHTCPAKSAARLIAAVAVEKLLDRLPDVELDCGVEQLEWRQGPFHRALVALPVRFPPIAVPATAAMDETSGAAAWKPKPEPSSSTPPDGTSTARVPESAKPALSRLWSFLVGSKPGR